jgi:CHAT domain-containing protein
MQKTSGRDRPRLWWCVTGELGFLPIHASGTYRGSSSDCIANYAVCSYVPTLSSLSKARRDWQAVSRAQLAGHLVCEESLDEGFSRRLPHASEEIALVRRRFEASNVHVLNTHSAHTSVNQLRATLKGSPTQILHLACHGIQDSEPLKSALQLQDGKLTIEDIMELDLPHAVLAYLSACQTAKGDRNVPDQAVHLAASMLFCGFRSVIGTMWCVSNAIT